MTSPPVILVTPQELSQSLNPVQVRAHTGLTFRKLKRSLPSARAARVLYAIDTDLPRHCAASSIPGLRSAWSDVVCNLGTGEPRPSYFKRCQQVESYRSQGSYSG